MKRILQIVLTVALLLCVGAASRASDRIVVVDDPYDYDPWLPNGIHISGTQTKLNDLVKRANLTSNLTSYELVDYGGEQKITFSWQGTGDRLYVKMVVNSDVEQVVAAAAPQGTFRFEILELVNCTLTIDLGSKELHYAAPGLYGFTTDYEYATDLGRYGSVGSFHFQSLPVDDAQPYGGTIKMVQYTITANAENEALKARAQQIAGASEEYHGELQVPVSGTEAISLGGVAGEPLMFSVVFDVAVNQATVTADIPADDVKVRWVSSWKPFLMNDPSLGGTDATVDALQMAAVDVVPGSGAAEKAWVSLVVPQDAQGTLSGTVTVHAGAGVYRTIPVDIEVYPFSLVEQPAVRVGIFVVSNYYDELSWGMMHEWLRKALVEIPTFPTAVPMKYLDGFDQTGAPYQQDDMEACFQNRRWHGVESKQLFTAGLLNYDLWRFLFGPSGDRYQVDPWIGDSVAGKIDYTLSRLQAEGVEELWVYSWDEAKGNDLYAHEPIWEIARAHGARWFAAIHPFYYEDQVVRDNIDMWIMTERNYLFSQMLRSAGKLTGKYGYPFTDVHGFSVHREEFMKSLYSDVDFYFNYALNDINGTPFSDLRKMCLVVPTDLGLIETESSEGFVRAAWDMRYVATLEELASGPLASIGAPALAAEALDYLDALHPNVNYNTMKDTLAYYIAQLGAESVLHLTSQGGEGEQAPGGSGSGETASGDGEAQQDPGSGAVAETSSALAQDGRMAVPTETVPVKPVGEAVGRARSSRSVSALGEGGRRGVIPGGSRRSVRFAFVARRGERYEVEVMTGTLGDSMLRVYKPGRAHPLASDDDSGIGLGSRLEFTAEKRGVHEIEVRAPVRGDTGDFWVYVRKLGGEI